MKNASSTATKKCNANIKKGNPKKANLARIKVNATLQALSELFGVPVKRPIQLSLDDMAWQEQQRKKREAEFRKRCKGKKVFYTISTTGTACEGVDTYAFKTRESAVAFAKRDAQGICGYKILKNVGTRVGKKGNYTAFISESVERPDNLIITAKCEQTGCVVNYYLQKVIVDYFA